MSSTLTESSRVRAFPTTVGFNATTGFLPTVVAAVESLAISGVLAPPQNQGYSCHKNAPCSKDRSSEMYIAFFSASAPVTPHCAAIDEDHIGWKGLLQMSRDSGTSGVLGARSEEEDNLNRNCQLEVCATAHTNPAIRRLVKSVIRGLKACQEPDMPQEGMGGTYFFPNENGRKVAILKPCDEEPLAPNNPKGYVGRALGDPGWKPTVRVGEAAMREVAAYLLDHDGFAKVPTSVLVRARHPKFCYNSRMSSAHLSREELCAADAGQADAGHCPSCPSADSSPGELLPMKLGSLQEFVAHECDTTEMGPSRFSVDDVHRIGILDIRLWNTDRHAGNMLVRSNKGSSSVLASLAQPGVNPQYELIPIDHGFCLPETLEPPYFEWLHWPQAMRPFSDAELAYIRNLDVEADKELLRKELPNLRPECLRVLELGTMLLQRCAAEGLTLYEIASILTRPFAGTEEEPSELEKMCAEVQIQMASREFCSSEEEAWEEDEDEEDEEDDYFCCDDADFRIDRLSPSFTPPFPAAKTAAKLGEHAADKPGLSSLDDLIASLPAVATAFTCHGGQPHGGSKDTPPGWFSLRSPLSQASSITSDANTWEVDSATDRLRNSGSSSQLSQNLPDFPQCNGSDDDTKVAAGGGGGGGGGGAKAPPLASSICGTNGFMYSAMNRARRKKAALGEQHSARPRATRGKHVNTAPSAPALTAGPDGSLVSLSGMDEPRWRVFMDLVHKHLHNSLEGGQWKQSRSMAVPCSCPRF